jgi:hypothetical protein
MLSPILNGSFGATGRMAMIVSSRGLTLTVSFQPISLSSGSLMAPQNYIFLLPLSLISFNSLFVSQFMLPL